MVTPGQVTTATADIGVSRSLRPRWARGRGPWEETSVWCWSSRSSPRNGFEIWGLSTTARDQRHCLLAERSLADAGPPTPPIDRGGPVPHGVFKLKSSSHLPALTLATIWLRSPCAASNTSGFVSDCQKSSSRL